MASRKVEKDGVKLLIKYMNIWATEISYLLLLVVAIFALLLMSFNGQELGDNTRFLIYSLVALGFLFLFAAQSNRKSFEEELEKL